MGNKLRMGNRLFVIMDGKVFIRRSKIERERQSSREELKYDETIRVKHQNEKASYFRRHKKNPLIQKNVDWSSKFVCRLSQKAWAHPSCTPQLERKIEKIPSIQYPSPFMFLRSIYEAGSPSRSYGLLMESKAIFCE